MPYIPGRKTRKEKVKEEEREVTEKHSSRRHEPAGDIDLLKLKKAFHQLEETHKQVRESYIEMILKMALAAEYKDPDTGNHILRISDYATAVGKAIGLNDDQLEILRYASPMHDIGKIGIPDRILQKPGKLTPEEWEIMKQHTLIGARMFQSSKSPLLMTAAEIALSHHEKYDGSGYPHGIKGEAIPLFGRVVALVDVFDAMVSKRVYKAQISFEEGLAHIKGLAGNHLDPKLVKTFAGIERQIRNIYAANKTIERFIDEAAADIG